MTDTRRRPSLEEAQGFAHEIVELAHELKVKAQRLDGIRRQGSALHSGVRSMMLDGTPTGSGHGDPVGELVAGAVDAEINGQGPSRWAYSVVTQTLGTVVELLRDADNVADAILDPKPLPAMEDEGCTYHALNGFPGVKTRTPGSDLCRWCADFRALKKRQPTGAEHRDLEEQRVQAELARRYG